MTENKGPGGHPMSEIAQRFETAAAPSSAPPAEDAAQGDQETSNGTRLDRSRPVTRQASLDLPQLRLSADQIQAPAFFVDRDLSVGWIAGGSDDELSKILSDELEGSSDQNIFSLLLQPAVKDGLHDWQAFFSFVYVALRRSTSRRMFEAHTDFISEKHLSGIAAPPPSEPGDHLFQVDSRIINPATAQSASPTRIFSLGFSEGTLFLIDRDQWTKETARPDNGVLPVSPKAAYGHKETVCLLSARLNDSRRIADTMLPGVFISMMERIWKETDDVATALGGVRAGCNGPRIHYLFKSTAGRHPIFSAICCATRMNRQLQTLQSKLKAEQGWVDELWLNMGISHGENDASAQDPVNCVDFMIPGGALDQSAQLSSVAGKGEAWITKNAVSQLPQALMNQVVIGIEREGEFLPNIFARICDVPEKHPSPLLDRDMGSLAITRILRIEKPGSPEP